VKAVITGVCGQDGSYLAELLLSKGYEVYGMIRRVSPENTQNIDEIKDEINLVYGDLEDYSSLVDIISDVKPDELYNLAAQSDVGISYKIPEYTGNVTGLGVLRLLDAVRKYSPNTRFYQASTSELFGNTSVHQDENSPMFPNSPYAIAKLYGYWMVRSYRDGYNLHASNGILYNHESVPKNSPVIINYNGFLDIIPIEDLFHVPKHRYEGILEKYINAFIWNGEYWTKIISGSCYQDCKKIVKLIQTRRSSYEATEEHITFDKNNIEIKTKDLKIGDKVFSVIFPDIESISHIDKDLAKFLGYVVGDGYISDNGRIRLTGTNKQQLIKIAELITNKFNWSYRLSTYGVGHFDNCSNEIWQLDINNDCNFGLWLRKNIYTHHSKDKRVPYFILNSNIETKTEFFEGYYLADGRNAGYEGFKYKGFTSASATLVLGLIYCIKDITGQIAKCKCEYIDGRRYYRVQLNSPNKTNKGRHLLKDLDEVINIINTQTEDGWLYDIQTESQTFSTGPNLFKIHNSPRRGENFVTRKISLGVAKIVAGLQNQVILGNVNAMRDWGYAPEYVEGMWLMLQQDKPDDYILATGETHTIKEFFIEACRIAGLDYFKHLGVAVNDCRPNDVHFLCGDANKAHNVLGWKPKVRFKDLVRIMVEADIRRFNGLMPES
jgi:GDPmannose 4,6-dehydratase